VDEDTGLELSSVELTTAVDAAMPVLLPAVLLVATAKFDPKDVDITIDAPEEGAATTLEGSTSAPFPQKILVPSASVVEFVAGVVAPVDEAIVNRPVQVTFAARGAVN